MSVFKSIANRLIGYFLAGIFAILPLVITVAIVIWVAGFLQGYLGPGTLVGKSVRNLGLQVTSGGQITAYIIGWAVVLATVFLLGVAVETGARRLMQSLIDALFKRVPLIGNIYNTAKQLVSMLDRQDQADLKGMSVVYCIFGGDHGAGFLALLVSPQTYRIADRDYKIVIVPTAPIPFGGALLFVPAEAIIDANMSVDGLMSTYVSMGVTAPHFMKEKLPDQAESERDDA